MTYEVVIGLEVHAQLLTKTKLFCACPTVFGREPNLNTCPVCLGQPGTLPVLNRQAVEFAIRAGLATGCSIEAKSVFARKNYFYPDLPKGYQISQYELPVCLKGHLDIEIVNGGRSPSEVNDDKPGKTDGGPGGRAGSPPAITKRIGITRIHMEEDAGKLVHEHPGTRAQDASWVDFNRGGTPLLEIVSEPDMRSPQEAVAYLKKLRSILVYAEICDGNMEEGSLRCDANVSLRPAGQEKFGTKVELKNMNSFKNVEKAIFYEIDRQASVLDEGGRILQETRLWDADKGETQSMRGKEEAHDYRYFPDPDLLPLIVDREWVERVGKTLPELPDAKRARFASQYQLPVYDAEVLASSRGLADFFEACVKEYPQPKKVSNWVMNEFLRMIGNDEARIPSSPLKPVHLAQAMKLVDGGTISGSVAKTVLQTVFETGESPQSIVEKQGLAQISDDGALETALDEVIAASPKEVEKYKAGNEKLIGHFVGQVMKKTGGRANPAKVNELVKRKLSS
ncbi:MAG TPA: Asp-tRNA(Asn)/Glu-tRNA(Gln) amidotransferase subunit GatB [bacterium]|nr:Asp-tRNA(Asn)/Glu-tRNA(Gln) amidotransferase subunit GatB [bacterium]